MTFAELKTGDKFQFVNSSWPDDVFMKLELLNPKKPGLQNAVWLTQGLGDFAGNFTNIPLSEKVVKVEIETFYQPKGDPK